MSVSLKKKLNLGKYKYLNQIKMASEELAHRILWHISLAPDDGNVPSCIECQVAKKKIKSVEMRYHGEMTQTNLLIQIMCALSVAL
jgi:hypothetical protein